MDPELGPVALPARPLDVPAVIRDDSLGDHQPETISGSRFLRSEEGIEDPQQVPLGNALSAVDHANFDFPGLRGSEHDAQLAPIGHRIRCIQEQIEEQLLQALDEQKLSKLWLGRLAFEDELMDVGQIVQILGKQNESGELFGVVAVELGFITPEQRDHLLRAQERRTDRLGEIIAELGFLTLEVLEEELDVYEECNEKPSR